MTEQQYVKASKVAELLDISEAAAWRLAREKKLPANAYCYINGRTLRFDLSAVRRWAAEGGGGRPTIEETEVA